MLLRRSPLPALLSCLGLLALVGCAGGCRSRAHQDLYVDQLIAENRVLEDQLYEADYKNQRLRDELEKYRDGPSEEPRRDPRDESRDFGPPSSRTPDESSERRDESFDSPDAQLLPPIESADDAADRRIENVPEPRNEALEPPDLDSLMPPEIEMGTPVPPADTDAPQEAPEGQIELPDLTAELPPLPVALRIHPGLSGGHQADADPDIDGVYLVVQFIDEDGNVVDISNVDIDANMSIALIDPAVGVEGGGQLGRWDYLPEEIAAMRRDSVPGSLHVTVSWDDARPEGESVMALVRISNGDIKLQGKATLPLEPRGSVAGWVPRSGSATSK